jgi:hypothetical protein
MIKKRTTAATIGGGASMQKGLSHFFLQPGEVGFILQVCVMMIG